MKTIQVRFRICSILFSILLAYSPLGQGALVNNCDEASFRAALAGGGTVTFTCDGTIVLSNTIVIDADKTIDASGRQVTLSGGNAVRIFDVLSNVSLSLNNLTLSHGLATGADGAPGLPGMAGQGGAVRVNGGKFSAANCRFQTNSAVGGKGGSAPTFPGSPLFGALGEGGAVYASFAVLRLTNCILARNTAAGGTGGDVAPGDTLGFGGDGGPSRGGSISAISSQIILAGGQFADNAANAGGPGAGRWTGNRVVTQAGALYAENGTCTGIGLTWRGNGASAAGGACFLQAGEAAFASCVFEGNGVTEMPQTYGGAVRSLNARLDLVDCLLRNNKAVGMQAFLIRGFGQNGGLAGGGAVAAANGELGVTNCTFTGNLAQGGNGALVGAPFFVLPAGSAQGGGLFHTGTGTVVNCTFAANSAQHGWKASYQPGGGLGGGLASVGGSLTVQFSTIASNLVGDNHTSFEPTNAMNSQGAGCYVATSSSCFFANSILSGNFATTGGRSGIPANASGPVTDGGNNLSSDAGPTFTVESSLNNTDPLLRPLGDNGGPTPTMALRPDSPAINGGDSLSCPPTDQRGVVRPQLGDCDIGAYELPDGYYILSLQDTGPDTFLLHGLGIPNQTYRVEFSGNLTNWMDAASGFTGLDGRIGVEVDRGTQPQRFYRIAVP